MSPSRCRRVGFVGHHLAVEGDIVGLFVVCRHKAVEIAQMLVLLGEFHEALLIGHYIGVSEQSLDFAKPVDMGLYAWK